MKKISALIAVASLAVITAACSAPAEEADTTVVTEETVVEEAPADAMAPAEGEVMAEDAMAPAEGEAVAEEAPVAE